MERAAKSAWKRLRPGRPLGLLLLGLALGSCSSWKEISSSEDWILYVKPGGDVDVGSFESMLDPAVDAVEAVLGPFQDPVRIHVWDGGVELTTGNRGKIAEGEGAGLITDIPNLGSARVRAFHVRSEGLAPGGVFLGEAAPGAAVHELVHARLAEMYGPMQTLPLWFEEGLAQVIADGVMDSTGPGSNPVWVRDGLCAWPLSVLREQRITDIELEELLAIRVSDNHTVEDNLMVHFIGWALVFDLFREDPNGNWRTWLARMKANPEDARLRLNRSVDETVVRQWIKSRLDHDDAAVRRGVARGTWRIGDPVTLQLLSSALRREADMATKATLAINILASAGEGRFAGMGRWNGLRLPLRVLGERPFTDPEELAAAAKLLAGYQGRASSDDIADAFAILVQYWQE